MEIIPQQRIFLILKLFISKIKPRNSKANKDRQRWVLLQVRGS